MDPPKKHIVEINFISDFLNKYTPTSFNLQSLYSQYEDQKREITLRLISLKVCNKAEPSVVGHNINLQVLYDCTVPQDNHLINDNTTLVYGTTGNQNGHITSLTYQPFMYSDANNKLCDIIVNNNIEDYQFPKNTTPKLKVFLNDLHNFRVRLTNDSKYNTTVANNILEGNNSNNSGNPPVFLCKAVIEVSIL
jgi:hypothetical protein